MVLGVAASKVKSSAPTQVSSSLPPPVVMMPGILCSQLETRLENASTYGKRCQKNADYFTTWITPASLLRGACFAGHMNLTRQQTPGRASQASTSPACVESPTGVKTRPRAFGNTTGFDQLNPQYPLGPREELFLGLTNALKRSFGGKYYREGTTLRGAPYDWRKYGDECYTNEYFKQLVTLVEETSRINDGQAVTILCHSMGCNVAHFFLATSVTPQWKKQYVVNLIALAPSFAGAPIALHNYLFGTPYDFVPGFSSVFRFWPSLSSLLPVELSSSKDLHIWENTTLVASPTYNYTGTKNGTVVAAILARASRNDRKRPGIGVASRYFWPEQKAYIRDRLVDKGPGTNTHCLYIAQVPTMLGMIVEGDDLTELKGSFVGAGDGDVVADSVIKACRIWNSLPGHPPVSCEEVRTKSAADHQSMLWAPEILRSVLKILNASIDAY